MYVYSPELGFILQRRGGFMANNLPPNGNQILKKIRLEWRRLDLTNKVLLLVGVVLLFELIFSIFLHALSTDASTDTFFRITFSSVMGYFLGGMNGNTKEPSPEEEQLIEDLYVDANDESFRNITHIRTLFITMVCLACIFTLSIATFTNQTDYSDGLIQLRNIISTSIGFLISKATYRG